MIIFNNISIMNILLNILHLLSYLYGTDPWLSDVQPGEVVPGNDDTPS